MSALLDSLASGFCGSDARRAELDAALQAGLPGPRTEAWKYTSLRQLERRSFQPAPLAPAVVDAALLADIPSPRLVFVNGRPSGALSDVAAVPAGVQLATLSSALAAGDEAARFLGRRFERSEEVFARLNAAHSPMKACCCAWKKACRSRRRCSWSSSACPARPICPGITAT